MATTPCVGRRRRNEFGRQDHVAGSLKRSYAHARKFRKSTWRAAPSQRATNGKEEEEKTRHLSKARERSSQFTHIFAALRPIVRVAPHRMVSFSRPSRRVDIYAIAYICTAGYVVVNGDARKEGILHVARTSRNMFPLACAAKAGAENVANLLCGLASFDGSPIYSVVELRRPHAPNAGLCVWTIDVHESPSHKVRPETRFFVLVRSWSGPTQINRPGPDRKINPSCWPGPTRFGLLTPLYPCSPDRPSPFRPVAGRAFARK